MGKWGLRPLAFDTAFFDEPIDRCCTACDKWDGLNLREGRELLPMWVADMDFRCPPAVTEALVRRAQHPVYGYTTPTAASVQAMLDYLRRRHQLSLTPDQQLMLPCVVTGLRAAVRALTQPGDAVLVQPPVYGPFFDAVRQNGRTLVENPLLADARGFYSIDWAGLEAAFQRGIKLMLLCSPHNPVGRLWSAEELQRLYGLCRQYGVLLVADEIHCDFVYAPGAFYSALRLDEAEDAPLVVLSSASKTFNLAGLQQSALLTRNQSLKAAIASELRALGAVSGNIFALVATEAAYREGDDWLDGLLAYLDRARALLRSELTTRLPEAVLTPLEATDLGWIDLRAYGLTTDELMRRTHAQGVAFTPGRFFGLREGEGFLRFNFACPHSQTVEAVRRLERAIRQPAP